MLPIKHKAAHNYSAPLGKALPFFENTPGAGGGAWGGDIESFMFSYKPIYQRRFRAKGEFSGL